MTHTHVFRPAAGDILTCVICGLSREVPAEKNLPVTVAIDPAGQPDTAQKGTDSAGYAPKCGEVGA